MSVSTFKRYEKKYLITAEQRDVLLPVLSKYMDLDSHCADGQNYSIYNIYYDDANSDIIRDSVNADIYKEKLRLRSYRIVREPEDQVFLEIKKKNQGIGSKRRIKLKMGEVDNLIYRQAPPQNDGYLNRQITGEILYFVETHPVRPTVYLQYDRLALFGKDDLDFRITIDDNIRTRRNNFAFGPTQADRFLLEPGTYIMEIKFLGAMPMWLARELSEMRIFSRGFSKYGSEYKERISHRELPYYLMEPDGKAHRYYSFDMENSG